MSKLRLKCILIYKAIICIISNNYPFTIISVKGSTDMIEKHYVSVEVQMATISMAPIGNQPSGGILIPSFGIDLDCETGPKICNGE